MKYKKMITINIYDLEEALVQQYGSEEFSDLRNILFGDEYMNDCYKRYYFLDDGYVDRDDDELHIIKCVNAFLQDIFPDEDTVLIDISW